MKTAYLSLGSNVGDRKANLRDALRRLREPEKLEIARISPLYETEPVDVESQPWFLNIAVQIETSLFPMQLLGRIGRVEEAMGRKRVRAKGPRPIDIDIVLYGSFVIETPKLTVPHPRMKERRFVLEPMVELAPDLRHPVTRQSMRELLGAIKGQKTRRIAEPLTADSL
jgi:2-amino-4-hydroxy-6-hydroxymethyldihydropteridine diphosphokinase